MKPTTAPTLLVLAAGMGNRYRGLKQIDPVGPGGETIIDYSMYDALRAGFGKVVFVIRSDIEQAFKQAVGTRFEEHISVEYVFQELDRLPPGFSVPVGRTRPWGTLHAVLMAADTINEPFAVINADDFYRTPLPAVPAPLTEAAPKIGRAPRRSCGCAAATRMRPLEFRIHRLPASLSRRQMRACRSQRNEHGHLPACGTGRT